MSFAAGLSILRIVHLHHLIDEIQALCISISLQTFWLLGSGNGICNRCMSIWWAYAICIHDLGFWHVSWNTGISVTWQDVIICCNALLRAGLQVDSPIYEESHWEMLHRAEREDAPCEAAERTASNHQQSDVLYRNGKPYIYIYL